MQKYLLLAILVTLVGLTACSSTRITTQPDFPQSPDDSNWQDWGNYALKIDPATMKAEVVYDRTNAIHYEVTWYLHPPACGGAGCITAAFVSWDATNFIATYDVTIENPVDLDVTDIRMIFYNLGGKKIPNVDSFTRAFTGNIEPFIAFAKSDPDRMFYALSTSTEQVQIYWPPWASFFLFFKVSAWLWVHCEDPYEINGMYQLGDLYPSGGAASIGCYVDDWQNNVTSVTCDTTPLTGGVTSLTNVIANQWEQNITNSMGAPPGTYPCLITATSPNPQNFDLYHYLKIEIIHEPDWWYEAFTVDLPNDLCKLDFGIIADPPSASVMNGRNATGACSDVIKFPGWMNPPVFYATLLNLDPTNPSFQPWPVVRIDATNDGAFGWTNENRELWLPGTPIANNDTYCNYDRAPSFIFMPEGDDHRHYMLDMEELPLEPADCSDTFDVDQCALYISTENFGVGFQGFPGGYTGFDYTDQDIVWEVLFPPSLVGMDNTQVNPFDYISIDAMRAPDDEHVLYLYVAQRAAGRVEFYKIKDNGPGPVDTITHGFTIWVHYFDEFEGLPLDVELLPGHTAYEPAPGKPILCVLVDNAVGPIPPGYGGSVWIYDAFTGAMVDSIGDTASPAVKERPAFLDTDDKEFSVHITQQGPFVTKWNYF